MNPPRNSRRILNASDNPAVLRGASAVLVQAGFAITHAGGAAETLRKIEAEFPDLVLLDIDMSGVDGHELCEQIRRKPGASHLPVVFLSATRKNGLINGADGYLTWPVEQEVLLTTIKSVLRVRQAEARLRESEEGFRTTFDQVAAGLGHLSLEGEWTWINRHLCDMLGYTVEELLQKGCSEVVCPEDLPSLFEHLRQNLRGRKRELCPGATLPAQRWLRLLDQLAGFAGTHTLR